MRNKLRVWQRLTALSILMILMVTPVATAVFSSPSAGPLDIKSMYMVADHHTAQFDAWAIQPDGTVIYQASYNLVYASDPSGLDIDEDSNTLFVTTEFSGYGVTFEYVDATTMTSLGYTNAGGDNFAGVAVDDANDIVYTMRREACDLWAFDWDPTGPSVSLRPGFPLTLPGCGGVYGISLDEFAGILWVADGWGGTARAYDTTSWTEDASLSFVPVHVPIDIAVDRQRGFVYTVSAYFGFGGPGGSTYLSQYDPVADTEAWVDLGHQGVGVAVDEATGYVYVTGDAYTQLVEAWDPFTWTQLQAASVAGSPAGICIPQTGVAYNPLNLSKDDGLGDDECVDAGANVTYDICYDNTGNAYDVNNVILIDTLPAEVAFVSASGGGTYDSGTHTVTWSLGTLPAGAPQECQQLVVQVDPATPPLTMFTNLGEIDSDETGPAYASEDTTVCEPPPLIPVYVDIKPGSCPNPFNVKSRGVLPLAVLGTDEFDVTTIDPATIQLTREGYGGVSPLRWTYWDVATPFEGELCDCHELYGDGYDDLVLFFRTQEVRTTLGLDAEQGNTIPLTVTGNLHEDEGGTPIEGSDCIWVLDKLD
jgi:uncharacterized repeat protein (TIGR01451 family)